MSSSPAPASSPASAPANPANASSSPAPAKADTVKVFVGNLSFKTRENQLAAAFADAGTVVTANIITRGPRSLGYGFVEFKTDAEANKAVQLMNKKEIDGREINVEVAKPREESASPSTEKARGGGGGGFRGSRGQRRRGSGQFNGGGSPSQGGEGAPRPRGRGGFRGGRGGRPPRVETGDQENRGDRTPSATTLFVANLPFSVDDAGLRDIFKDWNPTAAHVVMKRNGRSKGFGFVEFKNAEDQGKALAANEKKEVQGRQLIVKVALTEQVQAEKKEAAEKPAEKKEEKKEEKPANP